MLEEKGDNFCLLLTSSASQCLSTQHIAHAHLQPYSSNVKWPKLGTRGNGRQKLPGGGYDKKECQFF